MAAWNATGRRRRVDGVAPRDAIRRGRATEHGTLTQSRTQVRGRVKDRLDKIDFMEKNKKWNVDNLSHTATDRTILSGKGSSKEDLVGGMMTGTKSNKDGPVGPQSEKAAVNAYADFVDKHEQVLAKTTWLLPSWRIVRRSCTSTAVLYSMSMRNLIFYYRVWRTR